MALNFLLEGEEYQVAHVIAHHVAIGGDDHHLQTVDLLELRRFRVGGAGHAGELFIQAEIILEGDGRQGLILVLNLHPFLGFDRLVQALGPAPAGHGAAGELVHDHYLTVLDDVIHVLLKQHAGTQGGVEMMHQGEVGGVVEALTFRQHAGLGQQLFEVFVTFLGEMHLLLFFVHRVVAGTVLLLLFAEFGHDGVHLQVQLGIVVRGSGNDQRRARLIDEDGIHLIHHRRMQVALHLLLDAEGHVVAQIIETEFVIGAVGDVGVIGGALFVRVHTADTDAHTQAEEVIELAHPFGVAARQIVINRDHMHALAGQGVEIGEQGGDQGLAFAGAHLGDLAVVEHHAADELDIEVAHVQHPLARLARHGEGLRQQIVQLGPVGQALPELVGLATQLGVVQRLDLGLQGIDLIRYLGQTLD